MGIQQLNSRTPPVFYLYFTSKYCDNRLIAPFLRSDRRNRSPKSPVEILLRSRLSEPPEKYDFKMLCILTAINSGKSKQTNAIILAVL